MAKLKVEYKGKGQLDAVLNELLNKHVGRRVNGNVASGKTQRTHSEILKTSFNNLWDLGFHLSNPTKLDTKHVTALCRHWYQSGLANKTMQSRLSTLRIMSGWIENPNLVKSLQEYLPDVPKAELRVKTAAEASKSWAEHGIDLQEKFEQADLHDKHFGIMLRLELAFGLRRDEVLQFKPHKSDFGNRIKIFEAKNGRMRDVDILTEGQRYALDMAKGICKSKLQPLGWLETKKGKAATLAQNEKRYNQCMKNIGITKAAAGVTGHGLRSQFAENLALHSKLIPPTLGGTGGQMSKDDLDLKRAQVSEQLGHSRISITSAYYGSFGRNVTLDKVTRCRDNIESGLKYSNKGVTVPEARMADCLAIITELSHLGIDLSPRQAHMFWEINSRHRHALNWVTPDQGIVEAIEVVALSLAKKD